MQQPTVLMYYVYGSTFTSAVTCKMAQLRTLYFTDLLVKWECLCKLAEILPSHKAGYTDRKSILQRALQSNLALIIVWRQTQD